jgi:pilus assembly protein CpaB
LHRRGRHSVPKPALTEAMSLRTPVLLLLALILAGTTALLARSWLAAQREAVTAEASPVALPTPAKSVLITRAGIQRGQIIKPDDMIWQPWPEGGLDKAYIVIGTRSPESFSGWVARNPIAAGEPITESKIVAPGNRGFLAAVLRPGMRAISVPVTATSGAAGFIFPGDTVDVLITYPVPALEQVNNNGNNAQRYEHKAAETVLQDVRVIAIDQKLETRAGEAVVARTATLELTPKQSEIVSLASEIGKLSLSLRSLVPGNTEQPVGSASGSNDSSGTATAVTFTLDHEVSPLLPKPLQTRENLPGEGVTILRGGQKGGDSATSQPASRGS